MTPLAPIETDIVLVGGGHAHVEVIRRFGMKPEPGVRLTLISTPVDTPYSGMLPGHLAGHYNFDDYTVDLRRLCRFGNTRLIVSRVTEIDRAAKRVILKDRPAVSYDTLSLDIGSIPDTAGIVGAAHAIPIKPVPAFLQKWADIEAKAVAGVGARIVVVGAGAGGVEATLSLQYRLAQRLAEDGWGTTAPHFTIVSRAAELLPGHVAGVRKRLGAELNRKGIDVLLGETVTEIGATGVTCASGRVISADTVILVTAGRAANWMAASGLACDDNGFVRVGETLQSVGDPDIFAVGDCAAFEPQPLPKAGVYAVRQGPVLADNLRRITQGTTPAPFRPQRKILALVSLGEKRAVASRGSFSAEGRWVWRWKDRIDRRWMDRYDDLPEMAVSPPARSGHDQPMRCGGCGAKVPQAILHSVLARLRADPETAGGLALEHPDDAAEVRLPSGGRLLQTVDQFRAFIDDPWLFGRIAANHCLGDIHAMGGVPHSALVTVTLPYSAPKIVTRDLELLLRGVLETLQLAGATLIGGHTAEGAEMSVGLSVNGIAAREGALRKSGAQVGDRIILTKALGTGVLMAGDMLRVAKGRDVQAALDGMLQSHAAAADIFVDMAATACTDVTGFGLGGHLIEILEASAVSASIDTGVLPMLSGAAQLLADGHASTLHPANLATIANHLIDPPDILADPQTAGGLVATLPATKTDACLAALQDSGYPQATIIGDIVEQQGSGVSIAMA